MAPALSAPLVSPLKQVNADPLSVPRKPKLQSCWDDLSTNPRLFSHQSTKQLQRWFADCWCLKPSATVVVDSLNKLSTDELLGPYKDNVTQVFTQAVKTFREAQRGDVRRIHVVDTLIPFLHTILTRRYNNYSFEVMTLLAGSLEKSDAVFTELVSAIDLTLQDVQAPTSLRHRTLQLALLLVSLLNQSSPTAYFLRRDLFSTLVKIMLDDGVARYAYESTLLLGLLANFRKWETRNPYGGRIEDFVEEAVMARIIHLLTHVSLRARDSYTAIADDSPPSFVASLSSLFYPFRELLSFVTGTRDGGDSTPVIVSEPGTPTIEGEMRSPERDLEGPDGGSTLGTPMVSPILPSSPLLGGTGGGYKTAQTNKLFATATYAPSPLPDTGAAQLGSPSPGAAPPAGPGADEAKDEGSKKQDSPFAVLPPEIAVILLPFYDLVNLNKAFCSLVFTSGDGETGSLPPAFISLSSYILSHASYTARSRAYGRLCLMILGILVEEGEGRLCTLEGNNEVQGRRRSIFVRERVGPVKEREVVRLCRQRLPQLPHVATPRPLIAPMLDATTIFLRHNLSKRLDVESYIVCLRLVQRLMQQLKTERIHLEYEWTPVWRAILSLASFVVARIDDLRQQSNAIELLISQIFITLSYAAYWGEHFFATSNTSALLHYELLHADATLSSLSVLLAEGSKTNGTNGITITSPSHSPNAVPSPGRSTVNHFALPTARLALPSSSHSSGSSSRTSRFSATESIANLRSLTKHLKTAIEAGAPGQSRSMDEFDPADILRIIEANLGGVELIESSAMGDLRRGDVADVGQESFFKGLMNVVCADALALIPLKGAPPSYRLDLIFVSRLFFLFFGNVRKPLRAQHIMYSRPKWTLGLRERHAPKPSEGEPTAIKANASSEKVDLKPKSSTIAGAGRPSAMKKNGVQKGLTPRQKLDLQQAKEAATARPPARVHFAEPASFSPDQPRGGSAVGGGGHLTPLELFARRTRVGSKRSNLGLGGIAELGRMADRRELWDAFLNYYESTAELADRSERAEEEIQHLHMVGRERWARFGQ